MSITVHAANTKLYSRFKLLADRMESLSRATSIPLYMNMCAAAPTRPPGKQELLRELRPPVRARERRPHNVPQPPPMATRWCTFQQMPSARLQQS